MMVKPIFVHVLMATTFFSAFRHGHSISSFQKESLDNFIREIIACRNIPGLSISLVREGRVEYATGYGFQEFENFTPVTNTTTFCIGSLTKGFTATIMAMLISENDSLSWDTRIQDVLGDEFRLSDEHRTKYATIRDILAHKTGVPGYFGNLITGVPHTMEELVWRLRFMPASQKFHSKYLYNNYMYVLAGYMSQRITGKPWEDLVRDKIFKPLRMKSSTFAHNIANWENVALPHMAYNGDLRQLDTVLLRTIGPIGAAGSICTDANDMTQWMNFNLARALDPSGHRLVRRDVFDELHTPQTPTPMPPVKKLLKQPEFPIFEGRHAYNLGWGSGFYRGYPNIQHGGRVFGYDSLVWLFPESKIGIFTSINGPMNDDALYALRVIHYLAADLLLGLSHWLDLTTVCTFPYPWLVNKITPPVVERINIKTRRYIHRPLKDYVGVYGHLAFGNITISINDSDGQLYLRHGQFGHALLSPLSPPFSFTMRFIGVVSYVSDADGWGHRLPITFRHNSTGHIVALEAVFIEAMMAPEFRRGVQWGDLPQDYHVTSNMTSCSARQMTSNGSERNLCLSRLYIITLTIGLFLFDLYLVLM